MCDFCEIVKKAVRDMELEEKVWYKGGLCIIILGRATGLPIVIRREHEDTPLAIIIESMKQTAKRFFPEHDIDEPKIGEGEHYHFYMRPKKEKTAKT